MKKHQSLKEEKEQILKEIEEIKIAMQQKSQKAKIDEEEIAKIVGKMTGIPVTKIVKDEGKKLANLENGIEQIHHRPG